MQKFAQIRTNPNEIFPYPLQNEIVFENPPCFVWIKDKENKDGYKIVVKNDSGFEREYQTFKNYFYPDEVLPTGEFKWNVFSGNKERGSMTFKIPKNAVEFIRPTAKEIFDTVPEKTHPRLLFLKEDIQNILDEHQDDLKVLKRNVQVALNDGIPKPPYSTNKDSSNNHCLQTRVYYGNFRNFADRNLIALGLAWQLLEDKDAAEFGRRLLLEICSWDLEHHFVSVYVPNDETGLSIARTISAAFDLLYDLLNDDERKTVIKAIEVMAFQCYNRIIEEDYESNPGNSHAGRIPAYLGEMAMMLKGYTNTETLIKYLNTVTDIFGGLFPHYGSADGGWGEGVFYASSYTKWYLPFFLAVERFTGKTYLDRPFYQNLSNFFLHFADKDFENHPFGDGYWCGSEDEEWPGFFAQNPYRVYANKFGPKEAKLKFDSITPPNIFKLHLLDVFLPAPKSPKTRLTRPASLAEAFKKTGVLSMRTSFETKDCMALLARASRFGSASHSHADQGSFSLFYEGTALITPSGYFGFGWGTKHHINWTNATKAHNTILVNGLGQLTFSEKPVGEIEYCEQSGNIFKAGLNLSDAYDTLDNWRRTFTMDGQQNTLIIEDKIAAENEITLDWCLHSLSLPKLNDNIVTIERNGIKLTVEVLSGLNPQVYITDKFGTDLNEGVSEEDKVDMPKQYHMNWKTKRAKEHNIVVKLSIKKL